MEIWIILFDHIRNMELLVEQTVWYKNIRYWETKSKKNDIRDKNVNIHETEN